MGGKYIDNKKYIKWNKKNYKVKIKLYENNRIKILLTNKNDHIEISTNKPNYYIKYAECFIDINIRDTGLITILKKNKIINNISTYVSDDQDVIFPIAKLNMGILRKYDYAGTIRYMKINNGGNYN